MNEGPCCHRPAAPPAGGRDVASSELRVEGLDCPNEARPIRAALLAVPGVHDVSFDLAMGTATVTYDPRAAGEQDLLAAVEKAGFPVEPAGGPAEPSRTYDLVREATLLSGVLLVLAAMAYSAIAERSLLAGLRVEASPTHNAPAFWALIGAIGLTWWHILPKAWRSARALRPDLHLLMTIAVIGAIGLGEWFEAATVAVLFGLANTLEAWSTKRVRSAVLALVRQVPDRARVRTDDGEILVPAERVVVGQRVLVFPGERIPVDGRVRTGQSHVDQSPITGESRPIEKAPGSEVFAGSINQAGALEVEATRRASDSVMAQVARLVRLGQARKSHAERLVDRFARYYTPVVLAGAVLIAVVPPLLGLLAWQDAVMRALVLLVISCPCALVISTPVAVVSAMTALARGGALVKAGRYLEVLADVRVVALDKTGTLTRGQPAVDTVLPLPGYSRQDVLRIAAAIEARSEHSLGRAIFRAAGDEGLAPAACDDFAALPGLGATGRIGGVRHFVGSPRLLREQGVATADIEEQLARHEDCHHTAMVVATEGTPIGIILAADQVRPEAREAVERLEALGMHTIMLTGDNTGTARGVAAQTGVDDVRAELLPAGKAEAVARLRDDRGTVAMVGDGINDAPALAAADVGIAMGTIGTDVAIQTADVALMGDDLWHLPWLLAHSRRTRRTIVLNIAAAVGIKVVFLALAATGLANLWMAIAADMGASLAVTFNGMRLLSAPLPVQTSRDRKGAVNLPTSCANEPRP